MELSIGSPPQRLGTPWKRERKNYETHCLYSSGLIWWGGGLLTVGVGISQTLLPALRTLSPYWVAFLSLHVRVCSWSFCYLLCCVKLITLGGPLSAGG